LCCFRRNLRQFGYDFAWARNHRGRSERVSLRNERANVVLDDKQLFRNGAELAQHYFDLFDTRHLAQVRVDHQHAV
jgi:hypothetical protein